MNKVCVALFSCLLTLLYSTVLAPAAEAQQRRRTQAPQGGGLPPAQFTSLIRSNSTIDGDLPVVDGLHLQEGQTRRPGAPSAAQPYQPGEPKLQGALVRWDVKRMPLRIWISEGKKLPDVPFDILQAERCKRVAMMLLNPKSFDQLPVCPGWKPEMNDAVAEGFEQWRLFEKEGLLSFGFVDSPTQADIVVFFTDRFIDAAGPGGTNVHGLTMGEIFSAPQVQMKIQRGEPTIPVVMELCTNEELGKLQADAAHEFGHALGIKAHSPYRDDIMYENRTVTDLSAADRATIRALYKTLPKYWYY